MSWLAWVALLGPVISGPACFAWGWGWRAKRDAETIATFKARDASWRASNARLRTRLDAALNPPDADDLRERLRREAANGGSD